MIEAEVAESSSKLSGLLLPAVGAVATLVWKVFADARVERRKNELKYVSDQIQQLYGPLHSLSRTSSEAWRLVQNSLRKAEGDIFGPEAPPLSPHETWQWRNWMTAVFMPINLQMEDAIVKHSHLIEGKEMPECFLRMLAHVESYRVTLKQWEQNDFTLHTAALPYPSDLDVYVLETYRTLSARQSELQKKIF